MNKDKEEKLDVTIRVRLTRSEHEKLKRWAMAYEDDMSAFVRRMLKSLSDEPPEIPRPSVEL